MVAVTSLQHRVTQTVTLPTGHVVPAGTIAMTNIKRFLSDPELWDQPDMFSPDRFLDPEGRFFKPDHFVPLGHGKRTCMGEPLVKAELFIFFVSLVQRVQLSAVVGREPDPGRYKVGTVRVPDPFTVMVGARQRD
jgi:cytochrome P450